MLTGREDLVARACTRARGQRSTLMVGLPGTGLSAVAAAVASALDVSVVHGTDAVEGVPFVPFAEQLAVSGVDASDSRSVYRDLGGWLADRIVVVDDAEHLDLASSVLLGHAIRGGATVVATIRNPAALRPSFLALTTTWDREEVGPLPDDALLAMAASRLWTDLDPGSVAGLLSRSAGLPVVAADLIAQAIGHGRHTENGFDFRGFRPGPRSLTLRGHRFEGIDPGEAERLAVLVLAGTLPGSSSGDDTANASLVSRGLARVEGTAIAPAGDLVIDVVLPQVVPDRWPHLARVGLDMLPEAPEWDLVRDRLRVLGGLQYDAAALLACGSWFLQRGRADLCLALIGDSDDATSLLLRARAGIAAGDDPTIPLAALDAAAIATDDAVLLVAVAHEWGLLLRERLADQEALRARIVEVAERLPNGPPRNQVLAVIERRRAFVGGQHTSGSPGHQDASTRALSTVMAGELHEARQIVADAPDDNEGADPEFERTLRVLVEFLPVVYDGQMTLARSMAEEEHRRTRHTGGSGAGLWGYNRAKISLHSGQYHHTIDLAVVAGKHLAWRDGTGLTMPCLALQAAGLARVGRLAEADAVVALFSTEERLLPRIAIGVARVRAEHHRWTGNRGAAAEELVEAGRRAIADGEAYSGVLALDEAFMLHPRPDVADELAAHAERSQLLRVCAERAGALLLRDVRGVAAAAQQMESMPMPGRAAHLWREAALLHTSEGREAAARAALRRATTLVTDWGLPIWPEPATKPPERLTLREWQVARRAARRVRSREIAAELGLSARTVDNHLASCFRKLGISSRDDLEQALDASVSPLGIHEDVLDL